MEQLNLFQAVLESYQANAGRLTNEQLYREVALRANLDDTAMNSLVPIGKSGTPRNVIKRKLRWWQQSAKQAGILRHVPGQRGVWELTEKAGKDLHKILPQYSVLAFSTKLGLAILGSCDSVFSRLDIPISLIVSSPPFPLANPRNYGNVSEKEFVDWITRALEPVIKRLVPGASVCLEISPNIYMPRSPARSMYCERLLLALHDRLGLELMDRLVWENTSAPPSPVQWASKRRVQLTATYSFVFWLSNDAQRVKSDNRRVLQPHTERHARLIEGGGERRTGSFAGGAYRIRPGSFGNETAGTIPRNIIRLSHNCADQNTYKRRMRDMGLPPHTAPMPLALPKFLIELLTEKEDVVADPFFGSGTTGRAAESLSRRWVGTEIAVESIRGASTRFEDAEGFEQHMLM
ncbi:site-specific DNA-methyltransferase [Noviherbaspirillum pedocola]|uniref:Methyltransferase n=1 Tax=Noviherbaspirillum pedocola TaxID=2801341 RepID=A0A934W2B9_9BURK|nr:site-specific DNA-methyltransferase [Noviherbaspirillum pedocola]MBK4736151.1 site-specific DNA-methyltransferase [Noviherbaspirillum pedocola]